MCGIVGAAGSLWQKQEEALQQLLIVDSLRGVDSTGVAVVAKDGEVKVAKQLGNPFELLEHHSFKKALWGSNRAIIGHNRYGTSGKVSRANAHPFEFDSLVGVHNGTLHNKSDLADHHRFNVDSENLYHHIDKFGLRATLDIIRGAWTLVWWDKNEETINFLRNNERPLWLVRGKEEHQNNLFWASEKWMIEGVLGRKEFKFTEAIPLEVNMHVSFHIDKDAKIHEPLFAKMEAKHPNVVVHHGNGWKVGTNVGHSHSTSSTTSVASSSKINAETSVFNNKSTVVDIKSARKEEGKLGEVQLEASVASYIGSKHVTLELLATHRDVQGSEYIVCHDPIRPSMVIRLYVKKNDILLRHIGNEILADIGKLHKKKGENYFFKVEYSSVKLVMGDGQKKGVFEAAYEKDEETFPDDDGVFLTRSQWLNKFKKGCAICSNPIMPEDENTRFTTESEVVGQCCVDSELTQYVKFIN